MQYLYQEAEKFINDIFWGETHDKDNKLNIEAVIHAKLVKDNEEKDPDYYNHRPGVVHVSSLSKCLRGVVLEMLGAKKDNPPDAQKLGVFRAGNLFEEFIVEALGDLMLDRQTEYVYKYKSILLTGRDDGTIMHEGVRRMLEAKSVHSDSFWHRQREGNLVATHNQMQIQTYLWLRRVCPFMYHVQSIVRGEQKVEVIYTNLTPAELVEYRGKGESVEQVIAQEKPDNSALNGIFSYISKDDCTVISAPVKYNPRIMDEAVLPALELVIQGYDAKDGKAVPVPALAVFSESKHQWQKNWLCTYCDYHNQCAGAGWVLEASNLVTQKNKEMKASGGMFAHTLKAVKPTIEVVGKVEPTSSVEVKPESI